MTKRERKRLAEALLDPSSTAQYLLSRLDEDWEAVTPAVLMKLGKRYGAEIVTDALRRLKLGHDEGKLPDVVKPVAFLERTCQFVDESSSGVYHAGWMDFEGGAA